MNDIEWTTEQGCIRCVEIQNVEEKFIFYIYTSSPTFLISSAPPTTSSNGAAGDTFMSLDQLALFLEELKALGMGVVTAVFITFMLKLN